MKLIHPIYLDVPMMVSFAAAIEGGIAFDTEVTKTEDAKKSSKSTIKGTFGLSSLFESLFDASIEAQADSNKESALNETRREQRAHTESSIAILLYDALTRNEGSLVKPTSTSDLKDIEHGSLVELSGQLSKNAIDAMIDAIDAIINMSSMAGKTSLNQTKKDVGDIRKALHDDRSRTPLSNVILNCSTPEDLTAVVTLRSENLRDLTLSELHNNTVRVIGKITRSIDADQTMSPFENYGLSMMEPSNLSEIFRDIEQSNNMNMQFGDVEVQGPAIQILPLMVFV
ncbi:hypothetical protein ACFPK9_00615 [Rubritalea spongiae]|uniref:Uncharacterized protein n=1 Tax=Rubritalea spongiae TaxID=430797 RepID=A0ABW5EA10_9BACT